jgi:hypothetical protein
MAPSACYPDRAREVNAVLETLADELRREVVYYFERIQDSSSASVSDIVSYLDTETPGTDPKQIHTSLIHTHLPKLDRRGWVDYDKQTDTVRYHGHDSVRRHLADICAMFE